MHYLPPYSPDYNPIKEAFSKVKIMMTAMKRELQLVDDIDTIVLAVFATITKQYYIGWIGIQVSTT